MAVKKTSKKSVKKSPKVMKKTEASKNIKSVKPAKVTKPAKISTVSSVKAVFQSAEKTVKKLNFGKFFSDAIYMLCNPVKYFTEIKQTKNWSIKQIKCDLWNFL